MIKKRTAKYILAAVLAGALSLPLLNQVRTARSAQNQGQPAQSPGLPPPVFTPATRPAVDANKILATADDIQVTGADFEAVAAQIGAQNQGRLAEPAVRKAVIDQIIKVKLLAREAERRKIDQKPDVKHTLEMQREQVLWQALAQDIQGPGNDAGDHAYFDANKSKFDEVKARHILIRTPDSPVPVGPGKKALSDIEAKAKADQIEAQVKKGGDFAALAKSESDDPGSGVKGGDLGTFAPWRMDPVFSKAALGLKPNGISGPVKTQFGYHIIQLLEDKPRTYDQAKTEVGQARWNELVSEIGEKYKTQYTDPEFVGVANSTTQPTTRPVAG